MTANSPRISQLASEMGDRRFRASYFIAHLKVFLADQIRALRGDRSQVEFGQMIDKPQSVVSRLENEAYGQVTLQTLIDIANKIDIALVVRFVDWPTFLRATNDFSSGAIAPQPYGQDKIEKLKREEEVNAHRTERMQLFTAPVDQACGSSVLGSMQMNPSVGGGAQAAAEAAWFAAEKKMHLPFGKLAA